MLPRDLYEINILRTRSKAILRKPDLFDLRYIPKKPIPEHFALIIGDIIHNLRSSLDYWSTSAVKTFGVTNVTGRLSMPFGSDAQNLETQPAYKAIHKAFPAAGEFIRDEIQPYPDGNGSTLSAVSRLNNIDKHNFILPAVAVTEIRDINLKIGSGIMKDCIRDGDATHELNIVESAAPISIQNDFKTSVEVSFPQGGLFENEPVIPALLNCFEACSQALERCEEFLLSVAA